MKIIGIIPARYGSSRFPGKPLKILCGKSVIQRTYEQASKALDEVWVATDHPEIEAHVKEFQGKVIVTRADHPSGTDRIFEAAQKLTNQPDYIVNIQGDEPMINPEQIKELVQVLDGKTEIATQYKANTDSSELDNPNIVKLVSNLNHEALYFSRFGIPYKRNPELPFKGFKQHIGIYAYRIDVLEKITQLPVSSLEEAESLEQLRWLENGYKIKLVETRHQTIGIDTPEDLERAIKELEKNSGT